MRHKPYSKEEKRNEIFWRVETNKQMLLRNDMTRIFLHTIPGLSSTPTTVFSPLPSAPGRGLGAQLAEEGVQQHGGGGLAPLRQAPPQLALQDPGRSEPEPAPPPLVSRAW